MIRQMSIAACVAVSALALSGCVSDYAYRDGPGDYYYGQPTVNYDYYGAPYGGVGYGGYGYGGYYGGIGYGSGYYGGYGYPYGYGGNTYIYPRYYYRDRDHRPGRPHGNNGNNNGSDGLPYYNRNVRGSDKIPGILERSRERNLQRPSGDGRGRPGYRSPDPRGQVASPLPRQGMPPMQNAPRGREMLQNRERAPQQQMRAPQQMRSAPVQRAAPAAAGGVDRGRGRVRTSEP